MKSKEVSFIFLAFIGVLMWNGFIIKRDKELFDAYNQPTPKERYCMQQAKWHPDCNVE